MRTAVVIVKTPPFTGCGALIEELSEISEAQEARCLPYAEHIGERLSEYAARAEAVLVCAEENVIPALSATLCDRFDGFLQCDENGSGVFTQGNSDLFLFSVEGEKRREFIKNVCLPRLKRRGLRREKLVFRMIGAEKDKLTACIEKCKRVYGASGTLEFSVSERYGDFRAEVFYGADAPKTVLDGVARTFAEEFSENLYALDDTPIEKRLCELLKVRGKKVSVAESFTGGGVGRRIVSVSGASEVYFEGLNTYDSDAKIKRLNVSPYTLNTLGAVSDQTAYEMCAGLLSTGDCGAAIATTGLAGPKSDESGLPVGLCFLAAGAEGKIYIARHIFSGTREEITEQAVNHALFWAYKHLK